MLITPSAGWTSKKITLSYITRVYSNHTTTISHPASGIDAGDILIFIERAGDNNSPTPPLGNPSGYTLIGNIAGTTAQAYYNQAAYYKIAVGNEESTSISGMTEQVEDKWIWQYRASKPLTSLSASTPVGIVTTADPSDYTIAASSGTGAVLGMTLFNTYQSTVDPRSTSITPDHETADLTTAYIHDYIQNTGASNYTFGMDDEGGLNGLFGFYLHNFL